MVWEELSRREVLEDALRKTPGLALAWALLNTRTYAQEEEPDEQIVRDVSLLVDSFPSDIPDAEEIITHETENATKVVVLVRQRSALGYDDISRETIDEIAESQDRVYTILNHLLEEQPRYFPVDQAPKIYARGTDISSTLDVLRMDLSDEVMSEILQDKPVDEEVRQKIQSIDGIREYLQEVGENRGGFLAVHRIQEEGNCTVPRYRMSNPLQCASNDPESLSIMVVADSRMTTQQLIEHYHRHNETRISVIEIIPEGYRED